MGRRRTGRAALGQECSASGRIRDLHTGPGEDQAFRAVEDGTRTRLRIKSALDAAGVEMPFPHRTLIVRPGEDAELPNRRPHAS